MEEAPNPRPTSCDRESTDTAREALDTARWHIAALGAGKLRVFRMKGLGSIRVQGFGCRVWGISGLGCRV